MKRFVVVAALAFLAGCGEPASTRVADARVVVTGNGAVVYAALTDQGGGDRLIGVDLDGIGKAALHDMRIENGVMKMREVPGGFPVPPHGTLTLAPMGKHAMVTDMANPPKPGTTIPVTFTLARQLKLHTTAKVESGTAMAM